MRRLKRTCTTGRGRTLAASLLLCVTAAAALVWVAGCAANDPFDPESLENRRPLINFFVTQTDTTQPLNPTNPFSTRAVRPAV